MATAEIHKETQVAETFDLYDTTNNKHVRDGKITKHEFTDTIDAWLHLFRDHFREIDTNNDRMVNTSRVLLGHGNIPKWWVFHY